MKNGGIKEGLTHLLSINLLDKSFRLGQDCCNLFQGFHLCLDAGKTLAIIGESGSGKTTLLNLIAGLDSVDKGEIICCGYNVTTLNETQLAHYRNCFLGFIFQSHFLLKDFSVLENVMIPGLIGKRSRSVVKERACTLLEDVSLFNKKNHLPNQLSGGESQRVAIARALMNDPALILADEPTGSLDQRNAKMIEELLFRLVENTQKTLIIVTHNAALASLCEECLNLSRPKV